MTLDFIPRQRLREALQRGFRLLPDHDYAPHEYAVLMRLEDNPEPVCEQTIVDMFTPPPEPEPKPKPARVQRTTFACGHPFTPENIYSIRGWARCRTCKRAHNIAYKKRISVWWARA